VTRPSTQLSDSYSSGDVCAHVWICGPCEMCGQCVAWRRAWGGVGRGVGCGALWALGPCGPWGPGHWGGVDRCEAVREGHTREGVLLRRVKNVTSLSFGASQRFVPHVAAVPLALAQLLPRGVDSRGCVRQRAEMSATATTISEPLQEPTEWSDLPDELIARYGRTHATLD
jgi:hypothetical protein